MHMTGTHKKIPLEHKGRAPQDYLEIFWQRKWWFILPLIIGAITATLYSYSLPPTYRSSTLILVEAQKIPTQYVSPTDTSSVTERLSTIKQQILSRTNLQKIAQQFGLHQQQSTTPSAAQGGIAARLKRQAKRLLSAIGLYHPQASVVSDPNVIPLDVIERLRKNIEVNVVGTRSDAFGVSYSGTDPTTVMRVTNTLASLFIEENLKIREDRAEGTTLFIEDELAQIENALKKQEQALRDFREQHRGALPNQLETNLRTLDRLQLELQSINESFRQTEESLKQERLLIAQDPTIINNSLSNSLNSSTKDKNISIDKELENLKKRLAGLRTQFNDNYPDVVILKKQIAEYEAYLEENTTTPETSAAVPQDTLPETGSSLAELQASIAYTSPLALEIETLKRRRERIIAQIESIEKNVELTPTNEGKLIDLTRDYEITQRNYEALLQKKLNAKIAENLEKRQKGEQFRIIDPANLPTQPFKPNRPQIILFGSVCSGGLGIGLILLFEYLKVPVRRAEDLQQAFALPVLVTVPENPITQKRYNLVVVAEPEGAVTEQYRILYTKTNDVLAQQSPKVIAISSAVPHEGKTTTALNLATVIARDFGKQTLLLEGDFKRPAIASYLHTEVKEGLIDILSNETMDIQDSAVHLASMLMPLVTDNLSVLPAIRSMANSSGLLSSRRMHALLQFCKEHYEFIIIDTPPMLALSDMHIFEQLVDGIIVVVRAEQTSQRAVAQALEMAATDKIIGFVLNGTRHVLPSYAYFDYART
jgi:polysaccharide chain length determinant protein (PEP-CTERM system associated)